jgi:hypothetical protein
MILIIQYITTFNIENMEQYTIDDGFLLTYNKEDRYSICRSGMTQIDFDIVYPSDNKQLLSDLESANELFSKIKEVTNDVKWQKLGYCGTMFVDWLVACKKFIENNKDSKDNNIDPIIIATYNKGCN